MQINFDNSYSYRWRDLRKRTLDTCFRAERCVSRERLERGRGPLATGRRRHGLRAAATARGGSAQREPRAGARAGGATDTYATGWLSRASAARPSGPRRSPQFTSSLSSESAITIHYRKLMANAYICYTHLPE